jgi:hypothetical protein
MLYLIAKIMEYEKELSRLNRADKFITKPEYEIKNAK